MKVVIPMIKTLSNTVSEKNVTYKIGECHSEFILFFEGAQKTGASKKRRRVYAFIQMVDSIRK